MAGAVDGGSRGIGDLGRRSRGSATSVASAIDDSVRATRIAAARETRSGERAGAGGC